MKVCQSSALKTKQNKKTPQACISLLLVSLLLSRGELLRQRSCSRRAAGPVVRVPGDVSWPWEPPQGRPSLSCGHPGASVGSWAWVRSGSCFGWQLYCVRVPGPGTGTAAGALQYSGPCPLPLAGDAHHQVFHPLQAVDVKKHGSLCRIPTTNRALHARAAHLWQKWAAKLAELVSSRFLLQQGSLESGTMGAVRFPVPGSCPSWIHRCMMRSMLVLWPFPQHCCRQAFLFLLAPIWMDLTSL